MKLIKNRCLVFANSLWWICKVLHLSGEFKVNILLRCAENPVSDNGHAWLTRNDVCFPRFMKPFNMFKGGIPAVIGENGKYRFLMYKQDPNS